VSVSLIVGLTCFWPAHRPLLVWNSSPSSPVGLYEVTPPELRVGDMAIAWLPDAARRLADSRHYLPASVPLVKQVAAVRGERVCAAGATILINGRRAAIRKARDPSGRRLPWWSGCKVLRGGELFLLSANVPAAFDGRYFGITAPGDVIGKARLLWER
jgi:conjugative transfer signal peptidase TraF